MRITKENLTRYDQHFKSWHRRRLGYGKALENWHQAEEAGAVAFYPVGGSALEGAVKFSFTETPPASGEKGPSNPSAISGVSSLNVKRFGKNCCILSPNKNKGALNFTVNQDGTIRVYGTVASPNTEDYISLFHVSPHLQMPDHFKKGLQYTATFNSTDSRLRLQLYSHDGSNYRILATVVPGNTATITIPTNAVYGWFRIQGTADATPYDGTCQVQIELGSQATEMELPAVVDSYNIPLGNTYYGGEIDLATGLMTVTHVIRTVDGTNVKFVDGGETTNYYRLYFSIVYSQPAADRVMDTKCTFIDTAYFGFNTDSEHYYVGTDRVYVFLDKTLPFLSGSGTVVEKANAYAAQMVQGGTPWSVTYKLATPLTLQLTPTSISALAQTSRHEPRLNTVYTDADSIQITYQKSPIRAAAEQEMAILGLGGNV